MLYLCCTCLYTSFCHLHKNKTKPTPQEKLAVWERKQCPTAHGEATTIECDEFWVKIAHVLELDIELLDKHLTPIMDAFLAQKGVRGGRR